MPFRPLIPFLLLLLPIGDVAATGGVQLDIGRVEGEGWSADGLHLSLGIDGAARVSAQRVQATALPAPLSLDLRCAAGSLSEGRVRCRDGRLDAHLPWLGAVTAAIDASVTHAERWSLTVDAFSSQPLTVQRLTALQGEDGLAAALRLTDQPVAALLPLVEAIGLSMPELEASAAVSLSAEGLWRSVSDWTVEAETAVQALDFSTPDGRHAGEGLHADLTLAAKARNDAVQVRPRLRLTQGQIYLEPVFVDFGTHPVELALDGRWQPEPQLLSITGLDLRQQGVLSAEGSAELALGDDLPLRDLRVRVHDGQLPVLAEYYLQPFLAGGPLDPLHATGNLAAQVDMREGAVVGAQLRLDDIALDLPKLSVALDGLAGSLHWAAAADAALPSSLSWRGGQVAALPLGATELVMTAHADQLRLDRPLRIPILDGALHVQRLSLHGIGSADMGARFAGDVEPLDLGLLTRTLGWPEMQGRLGGQLPGMRLDGGTIELDGALTAQVFDGQITITQLRVIDAFGVLPRIAADLHLRGLDLLAVTGTYDFGSIEGRLDGEVVGLRMLGGQPVAFDARIYTPPGDRSRRRISQRAIDNISAVAGGPTGIVSGGALRLFSDFPYRRLGWSCRLRDGVCHMNGVAPADDGGYYLVQGRGLPRINVIGHGRRVDWPRLLDQLQNVRLDASDAP